MTLQYMYQFLVQHTVLIVFCKVTPCLIIFPKSCQGFIYYTKLTFCPKPYENLPVFCISLYNYYHILIAIYKFLYLYNILNIRYILGSHNLFRVPVVTAMQRCKMVQFMSNQFTVINENKTISVLRNVINKLSIEFRSHHWRRTRSIIEYFGNPSIFNDVITIRSKCLVFEIHLA